MVSRSLESNAAPQDEQNRVFSASRAPQEQMGICSFLRTPMYRVPWAKANFNSGEC